jgi:hypothetical protein
LRRDGTSCFFRTQRVRPTILGVHTAFSALSRIRSRRETDDFY